jgi:hypothetical protein
MSQRIPLIVAAADLRAGADRAGARKSTGARLGNLRLPKSWHSVDAN